jgi:hypothetical protein
MVVRDGSLLAGEVSLSPGVVVTVTYDHVSLFDARDQHHIELGLPELMLVEATRRRGAGHLAQLCAEVQAATGVDPKRLDQLVDTMVERGLLTTMPSDASEASAEDSALVDGAFALPFTGDEELVLRTPLALRISERGFEQLDHDGRPLLRLSASELFAASAFRQQGSRLKALERYHEQAGDLALDDAAFDAIAGRLAHSGLLERFDAKGPQARDNRMIRAVLRQHRRLNEAVDKAVSAHEASEREWEQGTGKTRIRVVPVDLRGSPAPLALGMLVAYAEAYDGGRLNERFQFYPEWLMRPPRMKTLAAEPSIFLFSNYLWVHAENLAASRKLKDFNPNGITVHGGPDTPKYEADVGAYFHANPHVDIAVRGEGEATFAEMLDALGHGFDGERFDLSVLADVPGLAYRLGDRVIRTADRERIADLDTVPSPFLHGVFDVHGDARVLGVTLETNRGCPYGCTFCDWGSATLSRIRKFDLDRIFAELEWCAKHEVPRVILADANFGIFERDVEIAQKVAALKQEFGYPGSFETNYAKNTTKHLKQIVQTLGNAGILTEGLLSLQSMDADTLDTVKRSNIKVQKYDELAVEFRRAKLPLFIDLMLGLPGATPASFRSDLQGVMDREVTAKIFPTELLINSPMNEPAYREANQIKTSAPIGGLVQTDIVRDGTAKRPLVISTSSYTRDEYDEMMSLRRVFLLSENFGVLRQVSRFVRQELELNEVDFYNRLRVDVLESDGRWPTIAFTFRAVPFLGIAPVSWRLFVDEVHRYLCDTLGVADDSALRTVLAVQHALLPAPGRVFPLELQLEHDWASWYQAMTDAKDRGIRDWTGEVPPLRDLPPAPFIVDDPRAVCSSGMGYRIEDYYHADWELRSPVERAMPAQHLVLD